MLSRMCDLESSRRRRRATPPSHPLIGPASRSGASLGLRPPAKWRLGYLDAPEDKQVCAAVASPLVLRQHSGRPSASLAARLETAPDALPPHSPPNDVRNMASSIDFGFRARERDIPSGFHLGLGHRSAGGASERARWDCGASGRLISGRRLVLYFNSIECVYSRSDYNV
ncbi:hypothetical protein Mp_1g27430 [Marchantia polymorpha subsp. ruderalis]|uniref:Uncharacterized protein n=2 Tax=Marchantia polymorpha TaxID=3197 RepID=A0AAF6AUV3_MARPO|nr:hypothetical protein MARPO_0002s0136 [Marchantia polymorpha]BBN00224.1 hypothetical protein Mp_1g27430 [Marchantia polymorpha subsp. ruderalis]|eukprot:PTQ49661.1 hypothetical protein MARPO_0002s0136 [Marchantia polymorpha]